MKGNKIVFYDWMRSQPIDFIEEVCYNSTVIPEKFIDEKFKDITIEELRILDDKYIFNDN